MKWEPPIRGNFIKKPNQPHFPKQEPNLATSVDGLMQLIQNVENTRKDVASKLEEIDHKFEYFTEKTEEAFNTVTEAKDAIERTQNEAIEVIKDIKQGPPGKDAEIKDLTEEVLAKLPSFPVHEDIVNEVLSKLPPAMDEKSVVKKILKSLPKSKASLKIIQENITMDPMTVIDKILEMANQGTFKIPTGSIDGFDQTLRAFQSQIGRKGYLHGGGISNITGLILPGTNITITGLGTSTSPYTINSTGGGSATLAAVSAASLTTANSLYTMTSAIPVEFKTSAGSHLLVLDETNTAITMADSVVTVRKTVSGASATSNFLNVTGTLNSTNTVQARGVDFEITSAGSSAFAQNAFTINLIAGYNGSAVTRGLQVTNSAASTGVLGWTGGAANYGATINSNATTTGHNVANNASGSGSSTLNMGLYGRAVLTAGALSVGVAGQALNGTISIGGAFMLMNVAPVFTTSVAILGDNGATGADLLHLRNAGTVVYSITGAGIVNVGTWQATKIGLAYGGTNADLSATGGAQQFLRQSSVGAAVTVSTIALDDLSDVIIATPTVDQILRYNGTNWVNGANSTVNAGAGVEFYYTTTASDISTYKQITKTPQNVAEQDITVTANNNTVLFNAYSSPSTGLGGTQIDAGTWIFDVYAYASLLTLESHIVLDVYSRTTGGTETLLFSVNSGTLSSSIQLYQIITIQQAFSISPTDRLIVKVSGETSNVTNTTIHFVFGGTTHYSNISTPLVVRHNDLVGLQGGTGSGVTGEYYHLTSSEYTGTGTGTFVRQSSPTLVTPVLGVASATSINKVAITTPATGSTLTIVDGKTLTISDTTTIGINSITLAGGEVITFSATNAFSLLTSGATVMTFPSGTDTVVTLTATQTLTNKRITKRVVTAADATSITPNSDNADWTYQANTQAVGTLTINADAGTPTNTQPWGLKIKSTNIQTFSWNALYVGGTTALPTVTSGGGKIDYFTFIYDTVNSKWHYTGTATNF